MILGGSKIVSEAYHVKPRDRCIQPRYGSYRINQENISTYLRPAVLAYPAIIIWRLLSTSMAFIHQDLENVLKSGSESSYLDN